MSKTNSIIVVVMLAACISTAIVYLNKLSYGIGLGHESNETGYSKNEVNTTASQALKNQSPVETGAAGKSIDPITSSTPSEKRHAAVTIWFDSFIQRMQAGDLTSAEQAHFEQSLYKMVEASPEMRSVLANRFRELFEKDDLWGLYELERALSISKEGIEAMLPAYTAEILGKGKLAPYAMQQVAPHYDYLDHASRSSLLEAALTQIGVAKELNDYGGAMNLIMAGARSVDHPVDTTTNALIRSAITARRQIAQTDQEYFITEYNLYRLYNPAQALEVARSNLSSSLNAGTLNAALAGIRDGYIPYDANLLSQITSGINMGQFTAAQLDSLSETMASLHAQPRG